MNLRDLLDLVKDTFTEWSEDNAPRLGAAVAYYTAFSLAPLLIVVIAVAGLVFGQEAVRGEVSGQIQGLIGSSGAKLIQGMISNASRPSSSIIATVVGLVTLLLGATGLFGELQNDLNTIWEIAPKPRGILTMLRERLVSFGMVLVIAFVLLVSLVISAVLAAFGHLLSGVLPVSALVLQVIDFFVSFGIVTLLFATMYKVLPDAEIDWHDVWTGAAVTALLFTIGKELIGLYLGHSGVASTYGAAGSFVLLLLWVYYSAQIFFFGAEFTQIYANRYGSRVEPASNAEPIADQLRSKDLHPDTEHTDRPPSSTKTAASGPEADRPRPPAFPSAWRSGRDRRADNQSDEQIRRSSPEIVAKVAAAVAIAFSLWRIRRVTRHPRSVR